MPSDRVGDVEQRFFGGRVSARSSPLIGSPEESSAISECHCVEATIGDAVEMAALAQLVDTGDDTVEVRPRIQLRRTLIVDGQLDLVPGERVGNGGGVSVEDECARRGRTSRASAWVTSRPSWRAHKVDEVDVIDPVPPPQTGNQRDRSLSMRRSPSSSPRTCNSRALSRCCPSSGTNG